jgi:hypothetical protein
MGILFHGQCISRASLGPSVSPSVYSLHPLSANDKRAESTTSQRGGDTRRRSRVPWPKIGDSTLILPSHLHRSDKLVPIGFPIGGELCIRDDIAALQTVLVS